MTLHVHVRELATRSHRLMQGLDLRIAPGAMHTLMGASGSGKSSLLAAIGGSLPQGLRFDGSVQLDGRMLDGLPAEQRRVGLLLQDGLLFPHLTVAENLLFAVPPGPRAPRLAQVAQGLRELELEAHAHADPATLSGGQRMRVALMRALLAQPRALLLDEPFSRLDTALRARMRQLVFERVRACGIPALLVTHDTEDVADPALLTRLAAPVPEHDARP